MFYLAESTGSAARLKLVVNSWVDIISQELHVVNGAIIQWYKRLSLVSRSQSGTLSITSVNSVVSCWLQTVFLPRFCLEIWSPRY